LLNLCAKAMLDLDPLLFGDLYPMAIELVEHLRQLDSPLDARSSYFALMKLRLDKEIADMPRSFFLGTTSTQPRTSASTLDSDLISRLYMKAGEWKMAPYMLEPYLKLQTYRLQSSDDVTVESIEQMLNGLSELPSLMQLHWSSRLDFFKSLSELVHLSLQNLNAQGRMTSFLDYFFQRLSILINAPTSPSSLASALLIKTCTDLSRSQIVRHPSYMDNLDVIVKLSGQYAESEEVEAAVLLCLFEIYKTAPSDRVKSILMNRMRSSSTWLSLLSAFIRKTIKPASMGDTLDVFSATACEGDPSQLALLASLADKAQLSVEDVRTLQALSILASNFPSSALLDQLKSIHPKVVLTEPADLKNMISINTSDVARLIDTDTAEIWLKYLIGKLEKPAPAIIKADAAIALNRLLFSQPGELIERVPVSFFLSTLPALISATTDSRVNSWYIILLSNYLPNHDDTISSQTSEEVDSRFAKGYAFGSIIEGLGHTKNPAKISNLFRCLASLKAVPRMDFSPLLSRLKETVLVLAFVLGHVATPLATGGHYVSPSLFSFLRDNLDTFDLDSFQLLCTALPGFLMHVEKSVQAEIVTALLLRLHAFDDMKATLTCLQMLKSLLESGFEKLADLDQIVISVLPSPSSSVGLYRPAYSLSSEILDLDTMMACPLHIHLKIIGLLRDSALFDMKSLASLLQSPHAYDQAYITPNTLELACLPDDHQADLLVRLLDICILDPSLESGIAQMILRWICYDWRCRTS